MDGSICRDCLHEAIEGAACADCGSRRIVRHAELANLSIAHLDCDAFYASVEKRDDPSLRDRPVIVGHAGGRGVVTTACYIARRYGPRSAMPMFKALKMCPDAVVIAPDMAKYKRASLDIRSLLGSISDCIEPVSLDEAYLDLSDDHRLTDETPARALARIALEIEAFVGITISIGLSYNKFLAKLASDLEKPRGYSVLGAAEARSFLAGLPVHKLHGVGHATAQRMEQQGLATVADLQALPERELVARYGKLGSRLAQFVNGIDERRVVSERPTKSISAETTFAHDIRTEAELAEAAERLALRVSERLKRSGLAGRTLVVKFKTADFKVLTRNRQLGRPTQRADILIEQARRVIESEADGRAFRLIGVGVADIALASEADLPDLFT